MWLVPDRPDMGMRERRTMYDAPAPEASLSAELLVGAKGSYGPLKGHQIQSCVTIHLFLSSTVNRKQLSGRWET